MDAKDIKEIIETAGRTGISSLELDMQGIRLVIRNSNGSIHEDEKNIDEVEKHTPAVREKEPGDANIIKSPMVGTYYSSSAPGMGQFVEIGSKVEAGDILCIIEAMKVMNEITSEFSGKVTEIYVKNGDILEYGQPIMSIEKRRSTLDV